MREIKFRALDVKSKKFVYGSPTYQFDVNYFSESIDDVPPRLWYIITDDFKFIEVNSFSISEFTGLKDKNNVEIYEGDIVNGKTFSGKDLKCEVIYNEQYGCYQLKSFKEKPLTFPIKSFLKNLEVIGNIYEKK